LKEREREREREVLGKGGEFILTNVAAFHLNLNEQRCIVF